MKMEMSMPSAQEDWMVCILFPIACRRPRTQARSRRYCLPSSRERSSGHGVIGEWTGLMIRSGSGYQGIEEIARRLNGDNAAPWLSEFGWLFCLALSSRCLDRWRARAPGWLETWSMVIGQDGCHSRDGGAWCWVAPVRLNWISRGLDDLVALNANRGIVLVCYRAKTA